MKSSYLPPLVFGSVRVEQALAQTHCQLLARLLEVRAEVVPLALVARRRQQAHQGEAWLAGDRKLLDRDLLELTEGCEV